MLVLSRRAGQSILIGDNIEIQIAEIGPGRVRLAIAAPREVTVLRKEVKLTREANLAAARALPSGALQQLAGQLQGIATAHANHPPAPGRSSVGT